MFWAGQDMYRETDFGPNGYRWTKAANLITPLVIAGTTYRSVWQKGGAVENLIYLSPQRTDAFVQSPGALFRFVQSTPFPCGFIVEGDHP